MSIYKSKNGGNLRAVVSSGGADRQITSRQQRHGRSVANPHSQVELYLPINCSDHVLKRGVCRTCGGDAFGRKPA